MYIYKTLNIDYHKNRSGGQLMKLSIVFDLKASLSGSFWFYPRLVLT